MDKWPPENRTHPRVVIIGAGFAGLWAARRLARSPFEVVLLDRNNYHTFLPLLYQVAAAELAPEDIVYPIRAILRKYPRQHFWHGEAERVEFEAKRVFGAIRWQKRGDCQPAEMVGSRFFPHCRFQTSRLFT